MVSCSMGVSKSKLASLAVLWGGEGRGGEGRGGEGEAVYLWDKLAIGCKHPIVSVKISRLELN